MKIYKYFVNFANKKSLNYQLRQARLRLFLSQISNCNKPVNILDVGGSAFYWEHLFFSMEGVSKQDFKITITNIDENQMKKQLSNDSYYKFVQADARKMSQFSNGEFDIVHSNSVIEHVGEFMDKMRMALEVRRVGKKHFIQTPNFYFPVEPHFQAIFFHWMPRWLRVLLTRIFSLGHFPRAKTKQHAEEIVDSAQLLAFKDVEVLFPMSIIHREKVFGLTKSFIVTGQS